ncbi:uncharacterized protein N7483_000091 [Penicillium malachiteum]|uniref:uncharacterized protein n=1 Tax=Penicillium malachiteum TaxID=1324776 RepID=UPI002549534D|nr:uncharacterized protein N7483_000091 [Penicillium malachiteum]KAJ5734966.1 hypothetical protein N7483_000091 [Penicillium malachiteum]
MDIDTNPAQQRSSRKHLRTSDDDGDLEWSSDVSGQFDDADEPDMDDYKSPAKSVKRRRSNDWPLPEEAADYGNNGGRNVRNTNGSLGPNYKASPRTSPRGSASSLRNRHKVSSDSPRHRLGRRSRFVEATMCDSVSEKPPSVLFRDQKNHTSAGHRGSGIFRFGKAIASAFNPFGGWGKPSHEITKSPQKDALTQAEEAYAELKRAGYKGTNKGSYMQSQQRIDPALADQTWNAIQEKMGYATSPTESSACLDHPSDDSENIGVRRQKSRKELSRETKLIKKVSNLEDKLARARRELHQLSGNEERLPAPVQETTRPMSVEMDPGSYPRKFVPGALPTLPSERLLDQHAAISGSPEPYGAQITALPSMDQRSISSQSSHSMTKSPKLLTKEPRPSSMGKESSSRKRKSTVPEPIASRKPIQPISTNHIADNRTSTSEHEHLIDAGLLSPAPRQSKWQKFEADESPGSVERKRKDPGTSLAILDGGSMHKRSINVPRRSSSVHRSPNSKNIIPTPSKRSTRSTSPNHPLLLKSNPTFDFSSPPPPSSAAHRSFYMQSHRQLDPDQRIRSSPIKPRRPSHRRRHSYHTDADIPPVPPLPKELLGDAAKVTKPLVKKHNPARDSAPAVLSKQTLDFLSQTPTTGEAFSWPDDIF